MNILVRFGSILLLLTPGFLFSQESSKINFLTPAENFNKERFWIAAGTGALIYAGFSYGLYQSWYSQYELTSFHNFNDWKEWKQMDKAGHLFTTHMEANLLHAGARWAGVPERTATWTAAGIALWLQTTIEVMDGFSSNWGFSWGDMAFNVAGAGLFVGQQYLWDEQRILMKVSSSVFKPYPTTPISDEEGLTSTLKYRADEEFGTSLGEKFLKDYNNQTIWASASIRAFSGKNSRWPNWLNVAFGYGAGNVFGAYGNGWTDENTGAKIRLPSDIYPRHRQYYLSLDVDLSRIPTKSRVLKTIFRCLNWIKIPAPALEFNSLGQVKGHILHW